MTEMAGVRAGAGQVAANAAIGPRGGFTIVELLVAIIILTIGVLGMAGTSAVVLRQMTGANSQSMGANVASSRFEWLASKTCASLADGSATSRGVTESWTVATGDNKTVTADLTVTIPGRQTAETYRTVISCF